MNHNQKTRNQEVANVLRALAEQFEKGEVSASDVSMTREIEHIGGDLVPMGVYSLSLKYTDDAEVARARALAYAPMF